jgi:choline dehydrogenase-like flavoprotein
MSLIDCEFYDSKRFLMSPFIIPSRMIRLLHTGMKGMLKPTKGMLGLMTKISDESVGQVNPDGTFSKSITDKDWKKLNEGSAIAREILVRAGVNSKSITDSKIAGSHPGGTAAIGRIVDTDLQTKADNLFVCDGSVLPVSSGVPPILTIAALAKRLARTLAA